ncbi:MAG: SDR family oxidoreductase [Gemmatimonadaceae bacterium]|nr:SDR family oxidoreductase [Gemmatimonadaceae bacterium]
MPSNRRDFLRTSALAGGALGLGLTRSASAHPAHDAPWTVPEPALLPPRAPKPLRILILGGTGFIGPHQVRYAIERGHKVTLFNRGKTNPGLFPDVEKLQGDRAKGDYESLKGRDWDVVIDNPTTFPRWVRQAAAVLKGHTRQFVFVSTISVYEKNDTSNADESAAVAKTTEPDVEEMRLYGALKALAEDEARKAFGDGTTIIRPGLIVGPGDLSDRFTYWPVRLERGGEVLAPGTPSDPSQVIDARDLSEFIVRCCEDGTTGTFNCTGPRSTLTIAEMLGGIRAAMVTDAYLTFVPADFLAAQKVRPWSDMPVWIPPVGETAGFMRRNIDKAVKAGLTFRPLADTVRATLDFYHAEPAERQAKLRAGLDPAREKEVLALWRAKVAQP